MNLKEVGQRVREAREAKGLSQYKLAKLSDLCRASIISLEQGKIAPRWDKMLKLKEVLGVKIKI